MEDRSGNRRQGRLLEAAEERLADTTAGGCAAVAAAGGGSLPPRILVSACLLGVRCRYNGKGVLDENVRGLMEDACLIPVCPEVYGGLATPRDPAEFAGGRVMTVRGADVTAQYQKGAETALHLARLYGCACAVLKERSPSCGRGRIYDGSHTGTLTDGDGVTACLLEENGIRVFGESKVGECRAFLFPENGFPGNS